MAHSLHDGNDRADIKNSAFDLAIILLHFLYIVHFTQADIELKFSDSLQKSIMVGILRNLCQIFSCCRNRQALLGPLLIGKLNKRRGDLHLTLLIDSCWLLGLLLLAYRGDTNDG